VGGVDLHNLEHLKCGSDWAAGLGCFRLPVPGTRYHQAAPCSSAFINQSVTTMKALSIAVLSSLAAPAIAWSRYNVGGKSPPMTCGGGIMNAQTIKNIKGENPSVPV